MQQNTSSDTWVQEDAAVYGDQIALERGDWYHYARIPNGAIDNIDFLGRNAFCVYCALLRFADKQTGICWPSVAGLCRMTGLARRSLFRELARLSKLGLIERVQMRRGSKFGNNKYRMINPNFWQFPGDDFYECQERHTESNNDKSKT